MEYPKNHKVTWKPGSIAIQSPNFGRGRQSANRRHSKQEDTMGERAYCSIHQRYLNDSGACVDCEKIELALSYAQDIVNAWPSTTMRTLGQMTNRVNALREALDLTKSIKTYRGDQ